jgi:ParB family chromosome partitioning protein
MDMKINQSKEDSMSYRHIDVDKMKRGVWQPRKTFDQSKLEELAASIELHGVIQPVVVRFDKTDGLYAIVSGERRWRAAQLACVFQIPATVRDDLTDEDCLAIALIENLQREDLNPIDEAEGFQQIIERLSLTHQQAADRIGKSRPYVTNSLRLLDLTGRVQDLVRQGLLETGHAKHLISLPSRFQISIAEMAVKRQWSVRQIASKSNQVKELLSGEENNRSNSRHPDVDRLENLISTRYCLPTRLGFDEKNNSGELVFKWNSLDELHGLLQAWGFKKTDL